MDQERHNLGCTIIQTADDCANGYRRNISQFNTASENENAERCANAASNTAWFILKALKFSDDEAKELRDAARGIAPPEKAPLR